MSAGPRSQRAITTFCWFPPLKVRILAWAAPRVVANRAGPSSVETALISARVPCAPTICHLEARRLESPRPIFVRGYPLKREPMAEMFEHQGLQLLSHHDSGISYRDRWLPENLPGELPRPRHQSIGGQYFTDHSQLQCFLGGQTLTGQKKISPTISAEQIRPDYMNSVARNETVGKMGGVCESGSLGGEDDVAQNRHLGMDVYRAVYRGDDRNLDVEEVHDEPLGVGIYMIPYLRGYLGLRQMLRKGFRIDFFYEGIPCPRHDHDLVFLVLTDIVESWPKLTMRAASPDESAAARMEGDLQNTILPFHSNVRVLICIVSELGHRFLP